MPSPIRYRLLLHALTPIAHGDTVTGVDNPTNVRLFMRQAGLVDGKPARVPAISENALRSVLFRAPLADDMIAALGIEGSALPQGVVNLLWSGGSMASGSRAPGDEIALGHAVKRLYPMLDLLGGAVDAFILPRSRLRVSAWLLASEYAAAVAAVAPDLADQCTGSAYDLLAEETRTRGTSGESVGNQMLYTYETLAAGARVLVELTLDPHTGPATAAALARALEAWDGYIGGQSRQGRGRMTVLTSTLPPSAAYAAHLAEHGAAMGAGLRDGTLGTGRVLCAK
jgi:hypothetical protein